MSDSGADKAETRLLPWVLVYCRVTWTTHSISAPLTVWLTSSIQRRSKGYLEEALTIPSPWIRQSSRVWEAQWQTQRLFRWSSFTADRVSFRDLTNSMPSMWKNGRDNLRLKTNINMLHQDLPVFLVRWKSTMFNQWQSIFKPDIIQYFLTPLLVNTHT